MLSIKDYTLITPANIEPITLDEVKQRLRLIGNGDFDSELTEQDKDINNIIEENNYIDIKSKNSENSGNNSFV